MSLPPLQHRRQQMPDRLDGKHLNTPDLQSGLQDWLAWLELLHPEEIELGLERVAVVAKRADLLAPAATIITVGGTNGKGSVVELLLNALVAAGYRVGAYTSPHLVHFNERIRVNHDQADDRSICQSLAAVDQCRMGTSLTYFEFTTLAAMHLFVTQAVDVVVLEVGLGGRLDAVNLWDTDCAVITSIAVDHESWLGTDREKIAFEKAAIARAGKPLVIAEPDPPAALGNSADTIGAEMYQWDTDFHIRRLSNEQVEFRLRDEPALRLPQPGLRGSHQIRNAAAALCALQVLQSKLHVPPSALAYALDNARLAGRMQFIQINGVGVILDVAHNPAAARSLSEALATQYPGHAVHAVMAVMRDKDVTGIIEPLSRQVSRWYCTELEIDRAMSAGELATTINKLPTQVGRESGIELYDSVEVAIDAALECTKNTQLAVVLVFGSFFTVSAALQKLLPGQ